MTLDTVSSEGVDWAPSKVVHRHGTANPVAGNRLVEKHGTVPAWWVGTALRPLP
jgi:hypothetical protein